MKVLVFGAGVIGSLTIHELCAAGNDVAVVARGRWKDVLEQDGLRVRSHSGKKESVDHPRVLAAYDGGHYDVAFSVMQNQQQDALLPTLAGVDAGRLVLVGNNMESEEMERSLRDAGVPEKRIFFGFQTSAGQRHDAYVEVVTFGAPSLTLGRLHAEPDAGEKAFFKELFAGSPMKLDFQDDMQAWYRCHAAFIVPIACISYSHGCDLRACGWDDMRRYIEAGSEAYRFLQSIGVPIRPKGDEKNMAGFRRWLLTLAMLIVAKTSIGEQAVTNHCRNAVREMRFMDERFEELRAANPAFPMPTYDALRAGRPAWDELERAYGAGASA